MNSPHTYFNEWEPYCVEWLGNLWPSAVVDGRDIREVNDDLCEYHRVHLFAGIGGWEYALQLANWPSDETVWTGSCPCQPFSRAGKRGIHQNAKRGRDDERHLWPAMFDLVCRHLPPVLFGEQVAGKAGLEWFDGVRTNLESVGYTCGMAVLPAACVGAPHNRERIFWLADSAWTPRDRPIMRSDERTHRREFGKEWRDYRLVRCVGSDGGTRRTGTRVQPLAARLPGDLGRLLAYGNSIVPQVAAEFIMAYMEAKNMKVLDESNRTPFVQTAQVASTEPQKSKMRVPQLRVLSALMPEDTTTDPINWSLFTAVNIADNLGASLISDLIRRALRGIQVGSTSSVSYPGLLELGYVESVTFNIDGVEETNYRITPTGVVAYLAQILEFGPPPAKTRNRESCTNKRYSKSPPSQ